VTGRFEFGDKRAYAADSRLYRLNLDEFARWIRNGKKVRERTRGAAIPCDVADGRRIGQQSGTECGAAARGEVVNPSPHDFPSVIRRFVWRR
jgi:hypothetical protein